MWATCDTFNLNQFLILWYCRGGWRAARVRRRGNEQWWKTWILVSLFFILLCDCSTQDVDCAQIYLHWISATQSLSLFLFFFITNSYSMTNVLQIESYSLEMWQFILNIYILNPCWTIWEQSRFRFSISIQKILNLFLLWYLRLKLAIWCNYHDYKTLLFISKRLSSRGESETWNSKPYIRT